MDVPGADRVIERSARDGKSLMADPERAPIVRRVFEAYATGRYTKQEVLQQARAWGLTNRRNRPLTSQAIGVLLSNQLTPASWTCPNTGSVRSVVTSSH